jgi:GT2 family glycosyltransferase
VTRRPGASLSERQDPANVAVVITTRDRPEMARATLAALLASRRAPNEIVVVDQSRRPVDFGGLPTGHAVRHRWSRERGVSRARNAGIEATSSSVLVFLDDDILMGPDWLDELIGVLQEYGERTVITGGVVAGSPERPGAFAPSVRVERDRVIFRGRPGKDRLSPTNMAIPRAAFDEIGLFDERLGPGTRFPSSEDNDLSHRLLEAGWTIVYAPEVLVTHRAWREERERIPLAWRYGLGQGAYWAKHTSATDLHMARRGLLTARQHLWRAVVTARRHRTAAIADVAFVAGCIVGALSWVVGPPPRKAHGDLGTPAARGRR